jgi:hypothetical protein
VLSQSDEAQACIAERLRHPYSPEAAIQEEPQATRRGATRSTSSRSSNGTPNSSASSSIESPAQNRFNTSSTPAPPRSKIGEPKERVGSATTAACSYIRGYSDQLGVSVIGVGDALQILADDFDENPLTVSYDDQVAYGPSFDRTGLPFTVVIEQLGSVGEEFSGGEGMFETEFVLKLHQSGPDTFQAESSR